MGIIDQQGIAPARISLTEHQIDKTRICKRALSVIETLLDAGYKAYLVGGCVRDLLLGITPKDFDVATDAYPEQVCKLFENSRLIGKRFRIVHVYFGRHYIEVSTFRAPANKKHTATAVPNSKIIHNNTFGSIEEDAIRRDFSINALYYDTVSNEVLDFCNGITDLKNKKIRMIGDPHARYQEDPVRMLRALRFRAKLALDIEPDTAEPIQSLGPLLRDIPPARLFDELIKLFHSGFATQCFQLLEQYDLLRVLFPYSDEQLDKSELFRQLIYTALENTDARIQSNKPVNPAFIFAILLWKPYLQRLEQYHQEGIPYSEGAWPAGRTTVLDQSTITSIPKRSSITICEIWKLQNRFLKKRGKKVLQLMAHPKFRAAYDFMCLRAQAGEIAESECSWWTKIQTASIQKQIKMIGLR